MTALWDAAVTALAAPSIFNTQPWRWVIRRGRLELWADRSRQLEAVDRDGRLLTISCGAALHHAAVALGAAHIQRSPDRAAPDLLAVLTAAEQPSRHPLHDAIAKRRTDRRPYTAWPVSTTILDELTAACEAHGAHLHFARPDQVPVLAEAAMGAGALQLSDPAYRAELMNWTHRPPWSGDGVPAETAVDMVPRRVPVREFAPFGGEVSAAGTQTDWGARYAILFTDWDDLDAWLRAGEALSAVLLTATARDLATATISEVTEVGATRDTLANMLPRKGFPQIAIRIGHASPGQAPPKAPRRLAEEVVSSTGREAETESPQWD